jgi:hypothetical protein
MAERLEKAARATAEQARADANQAHPAAAIAQVIAFTAERERKAKETHDKARMELEARMGELAGVN